jgi:glycosyltransferase involved in cell wall biosynthesis
MKSLRVGVFHPGTQHSWQTSLGLQEAGLLAWYATSAFYVPSRWPYKIESYLPAKYSSMLRGEFLRRHHPLLDAQNVRQFGVWEWFEVFLRRMGQQRLSGHINVHGNKMFGQQIVKLIEREPVDIVWGYNTSSLEVFQFARKKGIRCILDQTIGHPTVQNRVMLQEQARHPEFFLNSYKAFDQRWIERQNAELELADIVVVGADSCARTLIESGCPPQKIRVINYGYDAHLFAMAKPERSCDSKTPLKCLFVGEVGPRKGVAYLLQALASLSADKVELTLVGNLAIPEPIFKKYSKRVAHFPQVPRSAVPKFFQEAHCFIFPSLFEGSALVLNEAIGAGMGIIQSEQSGAGAQTGCNGEVLSSVSVPALVSAIEHLAANRNLCEQWQSFSWANRQAFTWDGYRSRIAHLAMNIS